MIETRLDEMLTMLRRGDILGDEAFSSVDLWEALNIRENETYRYFFSNELSSRWRILPIHADLRGVFEDLQAESYSRSRQQIAAAATNLVDRDNDVLVNDLSNRIQQEIGEIAMSRATEYATPWHDALWECYSRNEIPMMAAEPIIKPLLKTRRAG